jgi:hypothetical protein
MSQRQTFFMGLALGLTLSIGIAIGALTTPHATAQTTSSRWEYMTIDHGFDGARWANEAGANGWRYVGYDLRADHMMIFERPAR